MAIDELDSIINGYLAKYPEAEHIRRAIRVRMFFEKGYSIANVANQCAIEDRTVYIVLRNRRTPELDRHLLNLHSMVNGANVDDMADARFVALVIQYAASRFGLSDIKVRSRRLCYVDARTIAAKVLVSNGFGYGEIGFWLGVDRSSIYHMAQKDVSKIPTVYSALNDCIRYAEVLKRDMMK